MKDKNRKAMFAKMNNTGGALGEAPSSKGQPFSPNNRQQNASGLLQHNAKKANETDANELELFAENDGDLYRQRIVPIQQNLSKKFKKGNYDSQTAATLWKYAADDAAKRYEKEFGHKFGTAERARVAIDLERKWHEEMKAGNFHD